MKSIQKSIFFVMLQGIFLMVLLTAEDSVRVKTIFDHRYDYNQSFVDLVGTVVHYGDDLKRESQNYYLKDDWGEIIRVVTPKDFPLPKINERCKVNGMVDISSKDEVFFVEKDRMPILEITTPKVVEKTDPTIYYLIIAAALLLIVIIVLAIVMISSNKRNQFLPPTADLDGNAYDFGSHLEPEVLETPTLKITVPPPGTLKLLPGRLETKDGDDALTEIRFYKTKNQDETEITFGRGNGPNYSHIQLKPMTVSTKQAKLIFTNGKYTLINYSTTNPTMVNGVSLGKDDSVTLNEGSRIEMGEVVFIFHEK